MSVVRCQRTVRRSAVVEGFGYFSGQDVRVEFRPAPVETGIVFVRDDLKSPVRLTVSPALRIDAPRRTTLEFRGARVEMVEHILAALAGLEIDNCEVWVNAAEMPGCDGSALPFVNAIDQAGIVDQDEPVCQLHVERTIRVGDDRCWIEARPSSGSGLSISFDLNYEHHPAIGHQSHQIRVTPQSFRTELAPCRTFIVEQVALDMVAHGIGRRVTTQDLLIFGPDGPLENKLRFKNECARHKVLDVIGDLALTGREVVADVVAYRSGHQLHAALAQQLLEHTEETESMAVAGRARCA